VIRAKFPSPRGDSGRRATLTERRFVVAEFGAGSRVFIEQQNATDEFLEQVVDLVLDGASGARPTAKR